MGQLGLITLDKLEIKGNLQNRERLTLQDSKLKPSAVLVPLFAKDQQDHILFTRRTQKVEYHKGQISFPGGTKDAGDGDLLTTALRESLEEMGIHPQDVNILGALDDVVTSTGFVITPFVGAIPYPYPFSPFAEEIEEVLEVPVSGLVAGERVLQRLSREGAGKPGVMYEFEYNSQIIWGATAKIVAQFLRVALGNKRGGYDHRRAGLGCH